MFGELVEPHQQELVSLAEFAELEIAFGCYSIDSFPGLLKHPAEVQFLYAGGDINGAEVPVTDHKGVLATTPRNPAVLIGNKASFCSIMITMDGSGNAVLLHTYLTSPYDVESFELSEEADDDILAYRRKVRKNIRKSRNMTMLTGHTDSTEHNANLVVAALKNFLGKGYANVRRFTEPSDLENLESVLLEG